MYLFNKDQQLRKYNTVYNIIDEFIGIRLDAYKRRKEFIINMLEKELILISNKARFIKENCDDIIDLRKKKKDVIIELLKSRNYDIINDDVDYKYLRKMPMDSVCEENVQALLKEKGCKENELDKVKETSVQKMWLRELRKLEDEYEQYKVDRINRAMGLKDKKVKKKKKKKKSV